MGRGSFHRLLHNGPSRRIPRLARSCSERPLPQLIPAAQVYRHEPVKMPQTGRGTGSSIGQRPPVNQHWLERILFDHFVGASAQRRPNFEA